MLLVLVCGYSPNVCCGGMHISNLHNIPPPPPPLSSNLPSIPVIPASYQLLLCLEHPNRIYPPPRNSPFLLPLPLILPLNSPHLSKLPTLRVITSYVCRCVCVCVGVILYFFLPFGAHHFHFTFSSLLGQVLQGSVPRSGDE